MRGKREVHPQFKEGASSYDEKHKALAPIRGALHLLARIVMLEVPADAQVLCVGAGSAGLGVCTAIKDGMVAAGLSEEAAMSRFVLCNHNGALGRKDGAHGTSHRTAQHHASAMIRCCDLICCHDAQQRCADDAVSSNANSVGCMHELMTRCCCWLAEPAAASNTATHMRGCLLVL